METTPTTNSQIIWQKSDLEMLAKALTFAYKNQKTYSQPLDIEGRILGWKFILEDKYPMETVLSALKRYMTEKSDMPVPADIEAILNPPKPKISQAEFIHAKDQWAKEGYPSYSYYAMIVKDYEKENADERNAPAPIEDSRILGIVQNSVKSIL